VNLLYYFSPLNLCHFFLCSYKTNIPHFFSFLFFKTEKVNVYSSVI
jgi:hypothetical protein